MSLPLARLGSVVEIERKGVAPGAITPGTSYVGLEHISGDGTFVDVPTVQPGDLASTKFAFSERHVLFGKLRPYLRKTVRPNFSGICSTDIFQWPRRASWIVIICFIFFELTQWWLAPRQWLRV
jgi:type I restriction enzyme, S subunit